MKKPKKIKKVTPIERYLGRLEATTAALEILVDILPKEQFLEEFVKLHTTIAVDYYEDVKRERR